jgi:hypothetical protein
MKTSSKVFAIVFSILGLGSGIGALFFGATHQWAITAICFVLASILYEDACITTLK